VETANVPEAIGEDAARIASAAALERGVAFERLRRSMEAAKHTHLLMTLMSIAVDPPLRQPAQAPDPAVVMSSVWKALSRRAGAASGSSTDPVLHEVRTRAKRVRYAAEALAPFVGDRASAFAKSAARLQDVLGRHQDSAIAIDKLSAVAAADPTLASPQDGSQQAGSASGSRPGPRGRTLGDRSRRRSGGSGELRRHPCGGWRDLPPAERDPRDADRPPAPLRRPHAAEGEGARRRVDRATALREIHEETGVTGELGPELQSVRYTDPLGRPKVVRYWLVRADEVEDFRPDHEVDALVWAAVDEAPRPSRTTRPSGAG
jgi:Uncharacterized conserved protein